jgi:two-component system, NarL family, response regulator NreC
MIATLPPRVYQLLIVDDHPIVRHGIVQLLADQPDLRCRWQVDDAESALELLRSETVDLVIADISLPGLSGLDLTRRIASSRPDLPVLVMSMHDESAYADRAFVAGARGYLTKQGAMDELARAVRRLLTGGVYFSPAVERQMLERLKGRTQAVPSVTPLSHLNEREFEVLQMLAQGLSSADMAAQLHRSVKSIEVYRASLRHKLGARNVAELTRMAIELSRPAKAS